MNISDIARMAGVSKGTVSRVINDSPEGVSEETRKRIKKMIEDVGYIPNRVAGSITHARTGTIGIIIPDIQNFFFPQVVKGIEDCARIHGYTVFLGNSESDIKNEERYLRTFIEKRVDGIVLNTCGEITDKKLLNSLGVSRIPIVLMDRKSESFPNVPGIYVDNRSAACEGVGYLLRSGLKRIAYLGGNDQLYTSRERYRGYVMALEKAGVPVEPDLVLHGDYSLASGIEMINRLSSRLGEIDGIFAGSDMTAIGVIKALRERNIRVPEDIQVLGFDNIEMSDVLTPALTTMSQPMYEIGSHAMQKLLDIFDEKEDCMQSEYLHAVLIRRETTG